MSPQVLISRLKKASASSNSPDIGAKPIFRSRSSTAFSFSTSDHRLGNAGHGGVGRLGRGEEPAHEENMRSL